MRARSVALLLAAVLAFYFVVVGQRGLLLVSDPRPAFVLLGIGVLLLPLLGVWVVVQELRFGRASERLARQLEAEGGLPRDEVTTGPGRRRVDRDAADQVFDRRREEVEADPEDWRRWYRLGVAYGDAGDTARGRKALRRAITLHDQARRRA